MDDEDDDDEDDLEDLIEDDLASANPSDYTKSYNRQRRLNDPAIPAAERPKANPQKPKANTSALIDDQITSLSRHAAKLKLDSLQSGLGSGVKDDRRGDKSDRATSEQVLDPRTRMILLQMINRGVVSEVNGCISTGKEANVYHATAQVDEEDGGVKLDGAVSHGNKTEQRAIKIFKTSILVFKDRDKYVTGEYRFRSGYNKSSNRAKVKVWAEKEFRNLSRLYEAGLPVPKPHRLRQHVIVMDFVGDKKGWSAPLLRDIEFKDLSTEDEVKQWDILYRQLCCYMRIMYRTCKLVHADLSEYNLLYHANKLWIIDVGQSVEHDHPRSLEFLRMDIKNVTAFFSRKGVKTLPEQNLFAFITSENRAVDMTEMQKTLQDMSELTIDVAPDGQGADDVDVAVYRRQFLPQTLNQVPNFERDAEMVKRGEGEDLVYRQTLLAETPKGENVEQQGDEASDSEDDESKANDDKAGDGDESGDDEEEWSTGPRRHLKRFEDKEAKKEHKQAVKQEKREKRLTKMPKKEKKAAMKSSSKGKK